MTAGAGVRRESSAGERFDARLSLQKAAASRRTPQTAGVARQARFDAEERRFYASSEYLYVAFLTAVRSLEEGFFVRCGGIRMTAGGRRRAGWVTAKTHLSQKTRQMGHPESQKPKPRSLALEKSLGARPELGPLAREVFRREPELGPLARKFSGAHRRVGRFGRKS
jgi:hypothetical protein